MDTSVPVHQITSDYCDASNAGGRVSAGAVFPQGTRRVPRVKNECLDYLSAAGKILADFEIFVTTKKSL